MVDRFRLPTPDSSTTFVSAAHSPLHNGTATLSKPSPADIQARFPKYTSINDLLPFTNKLPSENDITYIIYSPNFEHQVTTSTSIADHDRDSRPCIIRRKLFGESHWMNNVAQFDKICNFIIDIQRAEGPKMSEIVILLHGCKSLGRIIKSEHQLTWLSVSDYKSTIPSKKICDELVGNYFRTFESVHRILHIPSFLSDYNEYWNNNGNENNQYSPFTMKFLLVLAIGSAFWTDSSNGKFLSSATRQWVYVAQQWLSAPLEKSRMNLNGIQIHCLLLLAREVVGVGSDLIWISAGSLLRTAMQLGYHRDPKHYPGIPVLHAEMRRRLWATVMELGLQASLDSAMPPMISMNDFDTEPPANINDADIGKETKTAPASLALTTYTQTSIQITLLQSLHHRLEIARMMGSFQSELSYDEVLRLNSDITDACRKAQLFQSTCDDPSLTPFRRNYFDFMIRRFILTLHYPWAIKARTDPRYYFSRKICLDNSLAAISQSHSVDYSSLLTVGYGIWRVMFVLPILIISLELIMQLEEEALNPLSAAQADRAKATREPLIQALRDKDMLGKERIHAGEVNIKCQLFTAMVLGQVEATEKGESVAEKFIEVALRSLQESHAILLEKSSNTHELAGKSSISGWCDNINGSAVDFTNYDTFQDIDLDVDMLSSGLGGWDDNPWF